MGMGSYALGSIVKIPFQITDGGVPISDSSPYIEKIVKPSGAVVSGFPKEMGAVDSDFGTYEYEYTPGAAGDYIVIISVEIDGETYVSLDNFTVTTSSSESDCSTVPRAESR